MDDKQIGAYTIQTLVLGKIDAAYDVLNDITRRIADHSEYYSLSEDVRSSIDDLHVRLSDLVVQIERERNKVYLNHPAKEKTDG